jgi:hypothetical protein
MNDLVDGLKWYEEDSGFWRFTLELENFARKMSALIARGDQPSPQMLDFTLALLEGIELWKAGCIEDQTGNAVRNPPQTVWDAFRDAINAMNAGRDLDALRSIMRLVGFGSIRDEESGQQRAKRASAVLRMFNPEEWGVVDWRAAYMLWALDKKNWNVAKAITLAKDDSTKKAEKEFDIINEDLAVHLNDIYRKKRTACLPRTADVEMAIFGLSFKVWEPNSQVRYSVGETYGKTVRRRLLNLDKVLSSEK